MGATHFLEQKPFKQERPREPGARAASSSLCRHAQDVLRGIIVFYRLDVES